MDVQFELGGESFVWDEEAASVFHDPYFKFVDASRNDESRTAAIGFDASVGLLFVVHLEVEGQSIRIISARCASSIDVSLYVE